MQCQDLDLSKSGETSQLSEELSEIKFSINRIIISKTHILHKIPEIDQNKQQNVEPNAIALKLKFYSVLSGCKLKQKYTRVSILKSTSTPYDAYVLTLQKDAINLKVSFPTNQEYEIMGKVYTYDDMKSQYSNSQKILIGTFQINLLEWSKEMRKQSGSSEQQKPETIISLRKVELKIYNPLQQVEMEQSINTGPSLAQGFEKIQTSETIENSQIVSFNRQLKSLQNFIQFQVLNREFVESIFNHFNLENLQDLASKQRKLKIVNSIVDEKIGKTHRISYLTTRSSQFYLLPERQVLRNMNRAKSQALLQPVSRQQLLENTPRPNAEISRKRQPKTFKQQIYQLLQQVKHFKNSAKKERQFLERNDSISRIKKIYYMMSQKRQEKTNAHRSYENPSIQRTITEFQELIPLSSVIKKSQSKISLSVLQNDLEPSISLNAKYKKVLRVQERLESFEKMRILSSLNLFQIQQSQELSQKKIKSAKNIKENEQVLLQS